jgi:[acyl-carrier-protein] S-malonyltransferase
MKKVAFLFPGQGTQFIGMAKDDHWFSIANDILGYDIKNICQNGPLEKLNSTLVSQPAIFIASVIMLEEFSISHPDIIPYAVAGLSLGEYTALYAAGVIDFEQGLKLVQERADLMQWAADRAEGGMVSIIGLDEDKVIELCRVAAEDDYLVLANYNCPSQIVISGEIEACDRAVLLAEEYGAIKAIKLDVAGAFHSKMMTFAATGFKDALWDLDIELPSDIKIISNIDAEYYTDEDNIRNNLVDQLTHPVLWHQCMDKLIEDGVEEFYEIGPKRTLTGLMKRINRKQKVIHV